MRRVSSKSNVNKLTSQMAYNNNNISFYYTKSSLSAQACLILVKLLDIDIETKEQELSFDDINPIFKVPVFVNEDLVLTDSRAIMIYLLDSMQSGSSFYSNDFKKRAIINQRLFYDAAVVSPSLMKLIVRNFNFKT